MPVARPGLAGGGRGGRSGGRILLFDIYRRRGRLHRYTRVAVERRVVGRKVAECAKAIARIKAGAPASIDHMSMMMASVVSMVPVVTAVMSPAIMAHSVTRVPVIRVFPSIIHPAIITAAVSTVSTISISQ
jgi:hypothetical protein